MQKNIGTTERVIRVGAGAIIVSLAFWGPQNPFAALGLVPLLTGIIGWCPPYQMLGISTCKSCSSAKK